jgi:hypothetical protein
MPSSCAARSHAERLASSTTTARMPLSSMRSSNGTDFALGPVSAPHRVIISVRRARGTRSKASPITFVGTEKRTRQDPSHL